MPVLSNTTKTGQEERFQIILITTAQSMTFIHVCLNCLKFVDLSCSLSTILSETSPHTGRKGAPIMQSTPVPQSKSDVQRCDTPGLPSGCSSSNKKRRKFPGPAGTLPKLVRRVHV